MRAFPDPPISASFFSFIQFSGFRLQFRLQDGRSNERSESRGPHEVALSPPSFRDLRARLSPGGVRDVPHFLAPIVRRGYFTLPVAVAWSPPSRKAGWFNRPWSLPDFRWSSAGFPSLLLPDKKITFHFVIPSPLLRISAST